MASVTMAGVYLAPVSDLSALVAFNAGVEVSEDTASPGEFRMYAGGRVRLIRRSGAMRSVQVSMRRIDRPTRELLAGLSGQLLLLRDGRGRKMYGSYLAPSFVETVGLPYCSVAFTFTELSFSEAV